MQPLQHDLQCPAAKDNTIMHAAAAPSHLDAAITLRSASTDFKRPYRTTTRCRTSRENQCHVETIAAAPAAHTHTNTHTRYPSSLAAGTLHGKTQGFVLRLPPQNKPHATFMQPLQPVTTLHHHHFDTLRQMYCCVMYSDVMYCCVMYCCVMYC